MRLNDVLPDLESERKLIEALKSLRTYYASQKMRALKKTSGVLAEIEETKGSNHD